MNIMKRLEELNRKEDQFYTMSPEEINDISIELEKLKILLEWLQEQLKNIDEGGYNTESKRVAFNMKNTTPYCFKKVAFPMLISNKDTVPVEIFNWSQDEVKEIVFYYDFDNDPAYARNKSVNLSTDANDIEIEFYEKGAGSKTGNAVEKPYRYPVGFSEKQGYIVFLNSFCEKVPEYDLKAKGRMIQKLLVDIFEAVRMDPDLESKTGRLMNIYLPNVRSTMHSYMQAVSGGTAGGAAGYTASGRSGNTAGGSAGGAAGGSAGGTSTGKIEELRKSLHETLNILIKALNELIRRFHSDSADESNVNLDILKKFMQEDGLL